MSRFLGFSLMLIILCLVGSGCLNHSSRKRSTSVSPAPEDPVVKAQITRDESFSELQRGTAPHSPSGDAP